MSDIPESVLFLIQSVLITIPGLITPGPVMAVTFERGTSSPHAGAFVTLGHGAVELPLVVLLFSGIGRFTGISSLRIILALAGGGFLIYMAWRTFRGMKSGPAAGGKVFSSSFAAGMIMTLANPFLILWWGTVGSTLIMRSIELGIMVSVLFYSLHFIVNFIWLYLISYLSYAGHRVFGTRYREIVSAVSVVILVSFGIYFIVTALKIKGLL